MTPLEFLLNSETVGIGPEKERKGPSILRELSFKDIRSSRGSIALAELPDLAPPALRPVREVTATITLAKHFSCLHTCCWQDTSHGAAAMYPQLQHFAAHSLPAHTRPVLACWGMQSYTCTEPHLLGNEPSAKSSPPLSVGESVRHPAAVSSTSASRSAAGQAPIRPAEPSSHLSSTVTTAVE